MASPTTVLWRCWTAEKDALLFLLQCLSFQFHRASGCCPKSSFSLIQSIFKLSNQETLFKVEQLAHFSLLLYPCSSPFTLKMVNTSEGIAYVKLYVYGSISIFMVIVVFRQGFQRQLGWIYLAVFCIFRITEASLKVESVHHPKNKTDTN